MHIETDQQTIETSAQTTFDFLSDFNNFESLFPSDKIKNWTATQDSCSFMIKGMSNIEMQKKSEVSPQTIHIVSGSKSPIKFKIQINIEAIDDNNCKSQLVLDADVNSFIKMMAERPLTGFFSTMMENTKNHLKGK